jgi:hypothetical protein
MKRAIEILSLISTGVLLVLFNAGCPTNPKALPLLISTNPDVIRLQPGGSQAMWVSSYLVREDSPWERTYIHVDCHLSVDSLPTGVSAMFLPDANLAAGGWADYRFLLFTALPNSAPTPVSKFHIRSTSYGNPSADLYPDIEVIASSGGGFTVSIDPPNISVSPGGTATYNVTVTSNGGFAGDVNLEAIGVSGDSKFIPPKVSVPPGGSATSVFSYKVYENYPANREFPFAVAGVAATFRADAIANVTTLNGGSGNGDFSLAVSPASITVGLIQFGVFNITVTPLNGYQGVVNLSVSGGAGIQGFFVNDPNPKSVTLGQSGASSFSVYNSSATGPRTIPLTVTASDGTINHTQTVNVVIP